jgi:hypothetical protein
VIQNTYSNLTGTLIDTSIDDLAILIDDDSPAAVALALRPGIIFGEERLGVGEKQLCIDFVSIKLSTDELGGLRTMSSSLIPLTLPHAFKTKASLEAVTATISTPLLANSARFSI